MKRLFLFNWMTIGVLLLSSCVDKNRTLEFNYIREGKIAQETIPLDSILKDGKIHSPYIDSVKFSVLDSLGFLNNNKDRSHIFSTPVKLDFNKTIEPYSPEYYTVYATYNIQKAIKYYNRLFDGKIGFNSQKGYKNIEITFGDFPGLTNPKDYILEKGTNPSPSLYFHEIGHRAFWYIQGEMGIQFKGLSYVHMGLLEYFTVSLNNSAVVGEDALPIKTMRNADWIYSYPHRDSLTVRKLLADLRESYPDKIKDPNSNVSKYLSIISEGDEESMNKIDNHRGGMIIASTLWRIRKQLGQDITDKLVAQTILNLNEYMDQRTQFIMSDKVKELPDKIEWHDFYYGLIQKDKELNNGADKDIIIKEFETTQFPIREISI